MLFESGGESGGHSFLFACFFFVSMALEGVGLFVSILRFCIIVFVLFS
jgi:hypothetical protein